MTIANRRDRALAERTRAILVDRFPAAFRGKNSDKPPLKIGIALDVLLAHPELSRKAIAIALADYTWGPTYCRNVVAGATRIGLDGEPAGTVNDHEAKHAARRMALFSKTKNRREEGGDER